MHHQSSTPGCPGLGAGEGGRLTDEGYKDSLNTPFLGLVFEKLEWSRVTLNSDPPSMVLELQSCSHPLSNPSSPPSPEPCPLGW